MECLTCRSMLAKLTQTHDSDVESVGPSMSLNGGHEGFDLLVQELKVSTLVVQHPAETPWPMCVPVRFIHSLSYSATESKQLPLWILIVSTGSPQT